jgi:hypothetical protein
MAGQQLPTGQTDQIVYAELVRAALAGEPCPTNRALGIVLGMSSTFPGMMAMRRLTAAGRIRVDSEKGSREVYIVEPGLTLLSIKRQDGVQRDAEVALAQARAEARAPLPPVIDRTPCFRCGIRADIGCSHRSASIPYALPRDYAA